ncbi:MAG TPA: competence protein ComEA [Clostridiaceae bacterium]|nr:competence protein ComEA [Clostridiaceae bacterium]
MTNKESAKPKRWLIALVLIVFLISLVSIIMRIRNTDFMSPETDEIIILADEGDEIDDSNNNDSGDQMQSSELFPVYITGEVNLPGVYRVETDQILDDLVKMAGGLTKEAAPEAVNLACELKSHQLYRIPSLTDLSDNPDLYLAGSATEDELTEKVNINTANQEQLESLPGVGPATAMAIIKHREKNGDFQAIEDIMLISGIKESRFRSLEDLITIN